MWLLCLTREFRTSTPRVTQVPSRAAWVCSEVCSNTRELAHFTAGAPAARMRRHLSHDSHATHVERPHLKEERGLIFLERHLEKNAGSTFREVIAHAERRGKCMYWGFQQRSVAWQAAIAALRNLTALDIPPRLCIEAHSGIDYGLPWLERFAQLRGLRKVFAERGVDIPVHFHVRLRSPLSHYVSYYLWTVVERQARNPKRFGSSFADWARSVPNLQSELLLSSKAAFTASFAPKDHTEIKEWRERWAMPAKAAARRRLVWQVLNEYDLLGTTDQFYESTLVVARALNWSAHDMAAPESLQKQAPIPAESCAAGERSEARAHAAGSPLPWLPRPVHVRCMYRARANLHA